MIGQDVSESSLRDVSRTVYENIKPQIYPVITKEVFDGKHTIKVEFSGESAPYSCAGRYYLRTAEVKTGKRPGVVTVTVPCRNK